MKNPKQTLAMMALTLLSSLGLWAQGGMGAIKGQIVNTNNEPVIGAVIKITSGGVLIGGAMTDTEGKYTYKPISAGLYEVIVQSAETQTQKMNNVKVNPEKTSYVDMKVSTNDLITVTVEAEYIEPIVDNSYITMKSIDADGYLHAAGDRMDIKAMIVSVASDVSVGDNGELHVRGGRGDATSYIIDGVKTQNPTAVCALSVENLSIITGGIPAQYGDMTSGVVVITTKDYFSGIRSKRMRETAATEKYLQMKREKDAKKEEERRKKEIEEEIRLEQGTNTEH